MNNKILDGHKKQGRWILAPVADITTPKAGRICCGPRWWKVTDNDEVLFFETYGSPQCNLLREVVQRLGAGFGAPKTAPRYIDVAFLPHDCSDYA